MLPGPSVSAAVDKVICVPWQGDPLKYHTAIDGQTIRLKAVVQTTDGATVWYQWVFGDGTESPVNALSRETSYNVEVDHIYHGSVGTPFTAQLRVDGVDATLANAVNDPYLVKLEVNGLDARVNIAIDNGLWYLHQNRYFTGALRSFNGQPVIVWYQGSYEFTMASPTASAIHAYQINGHKQTGNPDEDPYVLNVKYGFNWLFNGYYSNTTLPMLRPYGIGLQDGNDPDSNGNGIGIDVRDYGYRPIYQGGMVMDAIIASGTPDADCGRDFDGDGINETYRQVLQDMCDLYAWGQYFGGWRYNWRDFPDNSACQWAAIGMIPAQQAPWNCVVPRWVKTNNDAWLNYSHSVFGTGGIYGGFGYTGPSYGDALTPSGMVQLNFIGATTADLRWVRCERWFADDWNRWLNSYNFYAYYAFAKAMRLALPTPVTTFTYNGFDWYRGNANASGLAQRISDGLIANHHWTSPWVDSRLATAFAVIILRPVLFQEAPIACFTAQPNPTYPDSPIEFDPSCSDHSDPAKDRDNLILYEWDWESDGVFDEASTGPEVRTHTFSCLMLPCIQPVTLRVTDDVGNQATYRQDIEITNPPHPPVARTRGPFWVSLCDTDTLQLDATDSFDVDEGQKEAGCATCPVDEVTAWNWDLNGAPFTFDGPSGALVNLGTDFRTWFPTPGIYDIGVRVHDNTALAFPGAGQPNLSDDAFTQVLVFSDGVCHLVAEAQCQGAELSWDEVPGATFTVWVSPQSPNTAFREVASTEENHITITGLPVGVSRWVRVTAQLSSGLLMSEPAEVVAEAELCAPIADAGGPYTACAGRPVSLSAEASSAPLGQIVSWEWDLDNDGSFDDASGERIEHTFDAPGIYPIRVRVTAASAVVLTGEAGTTVNVDRCGCIDSLVARAKLNKIQLVWTPETDAQSYNIHRSGSPWFTPSEQTLIAASISTTFATYLDENLPEGITFYYRVVKVGTDGREVCASNEAADTPRLRDGNVAPAANAGPDQIVAVGDTVRLDGTGSFDADGNRLNYQWRRVSRPAQSQAELSDEHNPRPTFVADVKGAYTFELIGNDSLLNSLPDTVRITTQNTPPEADPGSELRVPVGTVVQLDGSKSIDPDGDALTYRWVLSLRPDASDAAIDDPSAQKPTFLVDAAGEYEITLIVNDGIDDSLPATQSIVTVNSPPVARVGPDQTVPVGIETKLDGSSSSDVDGDLLSYHWTLVAAPVGSMASVGSPNAVEATLIPDLGGEYQVQLVVNDGQADSVPALVTLTANAAPIANAGEDVAGPVGVPVALDGSQSSDPENDPLSYQWTVETAPAGSTATFNDATVEQPTFAPDRAGPYTLRLVVKDGLSDSLPDEVLLSTINSPPVANAGSDLEVNVGQLVALNGTGSGDVDGDPLTYQWTFTGVPDGSTATLDDPQSATPKFTADLPGSYTAKLIVHDGLVPSAPDEVQVATANRPPVANAGVGQAKFVGDTFPLNGSASIDPDNDPLSFSWTISLRPIGSTAQLQDPSTATPTFVPDLVGLYQAQVAVSDGRGGSASSTVNLTSKAFTLGPDLTGLTESEARAAIIDAGLHLGEVTPRSDEVVPTGLVLEQDPPAGVKLDPGTTVNLVVSSGPDIAAPVVTVVANPVFNSVGGTATLTVTAVDDGAVGNFTLMVDGQPVALLGNQATFVCPAVGSYQAVATVEDAVGNIGQGETTFYATDPSDVTPPTVAITAPSDDSGITTLTEVRGSVFDPDGLFASYTVEYVPVGEVDMSTLESSAYVKIGQGTTEVHDGLLAMFDPTLLSNDGYILRVSAWDQNGQGRREYVIVNVYGNLKLGNFRLEFTDLTVPVAGMPIQITRIYDTLQAGIKGDFGFGWRLGLRDARIYETKRDFLGYLTFYPGTRVYINTPDGRRVGFTAYTKSSAFFGFIFVEVALRPDAGVYDQLRFKGSVDGQLNAVFYQGAYLGGLATEAFDPDEYVLTTKDGTVYEYSQSDGLQKVTDLNGNHLDFTAAGIFHYAAGQTDPDQKVDFVRDSEERIIQIVDPNGNSLIYTYDAQGSLASYADQAKDTTQYYYRTAPAHYLDRIVDPLGRDALRAEYDSAGRLVVIRDALGNAISQDFEVTSNTGTFTDANGNVTTVVFDSRGNVTRSEDPEGGVTEFEYDTNNNEIRRKDPRGGITRRAYDSAGNPISLIDPLGSTTTFAWNSRGKPTLVTDPLGRETKLEYDPVGNVTRVINALGGEAILRRDGSGRLTNLIDFDGHTTQLDYAGGCSCGKPTTVVLPDGSVLVYEYDVLGGITREVDAAGRLLSRDFDPTGKLLRVHDTGGGIVEYNYAGGKRVGQTDQLGRRTTYYYDAAGRIIRISDPSGQGLLLELDANGNRTRIEDAAGNVHRHVYDLAGRLVQVINPMGHTNVLSYNLGGDVISFTDSRGKRRRFTYDAMGQRTQEVWWEGNTEIRRFDYSYDAVGLLVGAVDPEGTLTFVRDEVNRLTRATWTTPGASLFSLEYEYGAGRQPISVSDGSQIEVVSEWDNRNRLKRRIWRGGGIAELAVNFSYDLSGLRSSLDRQTGSPPQANAGQTIYSHNVRGAVTRLEHRDSTGGTLLGIDLTRDPVQQIVGRTAAGITSHYTYDLSGQLVTATHSAGQSDEGYTYDAAGNRVGPDIIVGNGNLLLSDDQFDYSYDEVGNRISKTTRGGNNKTLYHFDHRNRLARVEQYDGQTLLQSIEYRYDALDRRISIRRSDGNFTGVVYDGYDVWADRDSTGAVTMRYLNGDKPDELLARWRPGAGAEWYFADHLGSVLQLTDSAGSLLSQNKFDSFGRLLAQDGAGPHGRFGFTGREYDAESGLIYLRARYYDPAAGRFLSPDPLGFAGRDPNLFRYVRNSPLSLTDPFGATAIIEYSFRVSRIAGGASVDGPEVPTAEEVAGAMIGGLHGFGMVNLLFVGEVLGDPTGDFSAMVCRTEKAAEEIFPDWIGEVGIKDVEIPGHSFVNAYIGGITLTPSLKLKFEFFDFLTYEKDIIGGESVGGFDFGVSLGIQRLQQMFGEPPGGCGD